MTIFRYNTRRAFLFALMGIFLIAYTSFKVYEAVTNNNASYITDHAFLMIIGTYAVIYSSSLDKAIMQKKLNARKVEWQKQKEQISRFRKRYDELKKKRR